MKKRFLMILLAGFVSANAWAADTASMAPAAKPVQKSKRPLFLDQPYSATHTLTMRRQQLDGGEFTQETVTRRYRDSAGRERQDMLDGDGNPTFSSITGTDGAVIFLGHGDKVVSARAASRLAPVRQERPRMLAQESVPRKAGAKSVVEQLGERDIEGVTATGQVWKHRIGDGAGSLEVTTESWTSKELGITLYVKNSDATGESVVAISELDRSEPDPALFAAPDDYQSATQTRVVIKTGGRQPSL